jgi:DNA-binding NtrC family response regulator
LLAETRGNVSLAARRSGKERRSLGKLLKKYGIDRSQYAREGV